MSIKSYLGKTPYIAENVFIAESAAVIGDVRLYSSANIWYGTVLRGDINYIEIGENTNVQDNCVFHVTDDLPVVVGPDVTVGHGAILHGCTVEEAVLIGMGAIVLDGASIGSGSIIAAGTLVPEGKVIPPRSLVMGLPGKIAGSVNDPRLAKIKAMAEKYKQVALHHKEG